MIFIDAIVVKVRDRHVRNKPVYVVMEGHRERGNATSLELELDSPTSRFAQRF